MNLCCPLNLKRTWPIPDHSQIFLKPYPSTTRRPGETDLFADGLRVLESQKFCLSHHLISSHIISYHTVCPALQCDGIPSSIKCWYNLQSIDSRNLSISWIYWIFMDCDLNILVSTMPNEATGADPSHCSSSRPVSSWTQAVWILVSMRPEGRPSAKIGHRAMTKLAAGQKPVRSKQFGVGETPW